MVKTSRWTEIPNPRCGEKPQYGQKIQGLDRNRSVDIKLATNRNPTVDRPTADKPDCGQKTLLWTETPLWTGNPQIRSVSESLLNPTRKGTIRTEITERKITGRERRAHRTTGVILSIPGRRCCGRPADRPCCCSSGWTCGARSPSWPGPIERILLHWFPVILSARYLYSYA